MSTEPQMSSKEPEATYALAFCLLPRHPRGTLHASYAEPPVVFSTSQGVSSSGRSPPRAPMNNYSLTGLREGLKPSLRPEKTKFLLLINLITLGHPGTYPEQAFPKGLFPPSTEARAVPLPTPALHEDEDKVVEHTVHSKGRVWKDEGALPCP